MENRQVAEQTAARWIADRDKGPWTPERAAALDAWLAQSAGHRAAYYRLNAAWEEVGRLKVLRDDESMDAAVPGLRPRWAPQPLGVGAIAAGLLLIVGAALLAFAGDYWRGHSYSTVVGGMQAVPMADGSKVTLNTDSRLRVIVNAVERRVELKQGEAFFEVAKDARRPFIVSAGDQRIIAVGTAFSVRRETASVRVLVAEGAVRVESTGDRRPLAKPLLAGSIVEATRDTIAVDQKPAAELEQSLSWRSGLLTFRNTPLAQAVNEFNRYNTRKILIEDPRLAAIEIGGIFRATNLEPFVALLEQAFPVSASVGAERIVLRSR